MLLIDWQLTRSSQDSPSWNSDTRSRSRLSLVLLTNVSQRFPWLLPWVWLILLEWLREFRKHLVNRSLVCFKTMQLRNGQMKEMHREWHVEKAKCFHAPPCIPRSQNLILFTNPECLQSLSFWVFMEASLHMHSCNHWSLVIELNLQPLFSLGRVRVRLNVPTL